MLLLYTGNYIIIEYHLKMSCSVFMNVGHQNSNPSSEGSGDMPYVKEFCARSRYKGQGKVIAPHTGTILLILS